jgi:hypothetical protein
MIEKNIMQNCKPKNNKPTSSFFRRELNKIEIILFMIIVFLIGGIIGLLSSCYNR